MRTTAGQSRPLYHFAALRFAAVIKATFSASACVALADASVMRADAAWDDRLAIPSSMGLVLHASRNDPLRQGLERVAHAFVVGGDDCDAVESGERENGLPACAATKEAGVGLAADLEILDPPEDAVALFTWVGLVARPRCRADCIARDTSPRRSGRPRESALLWRKP